MNGEPLIATADSATLLQALADRRELPPQSLPEPLLAVFHEWYAAGYLRI
jgi:hypothetical protein